MIKKVLIILIFFIFIINNSFSLEIKIKAEIDNIIITNVDIEKEKKYLFFLNPKLKELNEQDLNKVAKNSLVREIIKSIPVVGSVPAIRDRLYEALGVESTFGKRTGSGLKTGL